MKGMAIGFGITMAFASVALAQDIDQQDLAAANAMWKALDQGQYLAGAEALRSRAFDANGTPRPGFAFDQWRETQGLMTNEAPPAPVAPKASQVAPDDPAAMQLASATATDAIAAIVERAKRTRVVILNEDHAVPRDRAFGLDVARALRPLGFDVLAVETLSNDADAKASEAKMQALIRDGYPRRGTGVYLRDPIFADFIRQSLALGYRPVAYETTDHSSGGDGNARIAAREQAQADYLINRALKAYPNSKLFIYVGWSHATENPIHDRASGPPTRWMAARLKAQTGIDPLTIDQTLLNDTGGGSRVLHAIVANRLNGRSAVMMSKGNPLVVGKYAGAVDLQVAHPSTVRIDGRPDWVSAMGRTPIAIPATLLPKNGTRLVQAFIASEDKDAIPVDQVLVTAGQSAPKLMLPRAPVRYAIQDPGAPGA
jgi:hypothetical protein